tara:strand:- start:70616 stop:71662 length:1047 start_codon:yes stop_codon:yes gene_type:complete
LYKNFDLENIKFSVDLGAKFLIAKQQLNGSYPGHDQGAASFWGIPLALMLSGYHFEAQKLLDWIQKNALSLNGDIGEISKNSRGYNYPYEKAWLIEGAHRFGEFNISYSGMNYLRRFWDQETGGFYSVIDPDLIKLESNLKMDLWVTSGCARAALYMGELDMAIGAARWMENLMKQQPNYPEQLYTVFTKSKGLLINKNDFTDDIEDKFKFGTNFRYVLNKDSQVDQSFFHPGIAGGFLALLYLATRDIRWLTLSKKYMLLAETASDFLYSTLRAGKTGWAAALLFSISKEEKYFKIAYKIADNIIKLQSGNGSWIDPNKISDMHSINLTAEMVIWLNQIHRYIKPRY